MFYPISQKSPAPKKLSPEDRVTRPESNWMIQVKATDPAHGTATGRIAVCIEFMLAHLHKPIRVSTLSTMAGLSESRFFELFKQTTGDSPVNWLIQIRMQCAGELLQRSNLRIKEIADQVGYEDPFYFSRLFKSVHGMAPSEYRTRKPAPAAQ